MNTRLKEEINTQRAAAQRNGIKRRFVGEASTALPVLARSHCPKKFRWRSQRLQSNNPCISIFSRDALKPAYLGHFREDALKPL